MTEKRKYEKPTMEVVECEQEMQLLARSANGQMDDPDDYLLDDDPFQF
jgi:hypothetical protein